MKKGFIYSNQITDEMGDFLGIKLNSFSNELNCWRSSRLHSQLRLNTYGSVAKIGEIIYCKKVMFPYWMNSSMKRNYG
jgi:hypothetical protein